MRLRRRFNRMRTDPMFYFWAAVLVIATCVVMCNAAKGADWQFTISGNSTTDCHDTWTHNCSADSLTNYGSNAGLLFGYNWCIRKCIIAFPAISDSIAVYGTAGEIDSGKIVLKLYSTFGGDDDSLMARLYSLKRTDWVEVQAQWVIYKTGSNWQTRGALGTDDIVTTPESDGTHADSVIMTLANHPVGGTATFWINPDNIANEGWILNWSSYKGATDVTCTFYASEDLAEAGPQITIYGSDVAPPTAEQRRRRVITGSRP